MKLLHRVHSLLLFFGFDPGRMIQSLRGLPAFFRDLRVLKSQQASAARAFPFGKLYPCLHDKSVASGSGRGHYFHQDLLVARRIFLNKPERHVDIGSSVGGFVAHVASYRPIEVLDIRAQSANVPNIRFVQADLTAPLDRSLVDYCDSVSCLHALEHFGLGRYGDPVKYDGYLLGLENIWKILKNGGKVYISVPIGPERIEFNAHRVFSVRCLLDCFSGKYRIDQFSFVDDLGDLHENVPLTEADKTTNFNCQFGCGIFEMTKM